MIMKLHYQTVSPILVDCLHKLMAHPAFKDFTEVVCMKGKYWEFIVEDLNEVAKTLIFAV